MSRSSSLARGQSNVGYTADSGHSQVDALLEIIIRDGLAGLVHTRVTVESRNVFASKAPSIFGVTLEQHRMNHAGLSIDSILLLRQMTTFLKCSIWASNKKLMNGKTIRIYPHFISFVDLDQTASTPTFCGLTDAPHESKLSLKLHSITAQGAVVSVSSKRISEWRF